jgi:hypothetical protein
LTAVLWNPPVLNAANAPLVSPVPENMHKLAPSPGGLFWWRIYDIVV